MLVGIALLTVWIPRQIGQVVDGLVAREMAAGEAMLAGFDGTLTLVLVVAMMSLGVGTVLALGLQARSEAQCSGPAGAAADASGARHSRRPPRAQHPGGALQL